MSKGLSGVFWIIENELAAFPYGSVNSSNGTAKSGTTYNHKLLWPEVKPRGCNRSYDYYPRGRVEISRKGVPIIYLNPNIDETYIEEIRVKFKLENEPIIRYDFSEHYKCYLDR